MQRFELPLIVDRAGHKTINIAAYGASPSNNVCCHSLGGNWQGTAFWGGTSKCLPAFGASQEIVLTDAWVPPKGYAYASCRVWPGGRINSVNYDI